MAILDLQETACILHTFSGPHGELFQHRLQRGLFVFIYCRVHPRGDEIDFAVSHIQSLLGLNYQSTNGLLQLTVSVGAVSECFLQQPSKALSRNCSPG